MFGFSDLFALIISSFIIIPVAVFIREFGYLPVTYLFGVKNPRLTIGSGPSVFMFGIFDIRKYYHMYSWFSFDDIKRKSNFAYIMVYAAPIISTLTVALTLNALIANGYLEDQARFWNRFIFYAFFYALIDSVPMLMTSGKPNNGMIIYELIRYGKRVDYNEDEVIPSTSQVDKEYEEEMKNIEEMQEEIEKEKNGISKQSSEDAEREAVGKQIQENIQDSAEEHAKDELKKEKESD
ncbi:hypothetical protein QT716_11370 [Sporosarcina aquimarina]|uniref:Uncharacterized protein n=1 Tax=Sporosarcina aquimarina TaxID=114975 RepID=A0ABU4G187_9BACL|nr:hypothetical protein [Sporosarcina aquimarina]